MKILYKIIHLIRKNLLDLLNYKFDIIIKIIITFFIITIFIYNKTKHIIIPVKYFYFVLTGIISTTYFAGAVSLTNKELEKMVKMGIIDFIFATPTNPLVVVTSIFIFNFFYIFIIRLPIIIFTIFILRIYLSFLEITFLCIIFFISLGISFMISIIISGLVIILKNTDEIVSLIINSHRILSGVYIPINFLPLWMQKLSKVLPLTYTVRSMRALFLHNYSVYFILKDIFILTIFFLIFLFFGIWFWNFAIKRAKIKGDFYY
jgi:ABC-2 type transport system permease protein